MYSTIKGLILRITNYNDHDVLLNVLTPTHGKITVKARGLRRKNSPLTAPCQLLAYSEFVLFEYKGMYTVNEARTVELFHGLRRDLQKLSMGSYFAQVAEVISQEDHPNPELLPLVLNSLFALSKLDVKELLIKAVFELRCACLAGYTPDLTGCVHCGNEFPDRFDVTAGHLECGVCRDIASDGIRMPISAGVLDALRYICTCDPKHVYNFSITDATLKTLSQVSELYLSTQLERGFSALDFYKTILLE